MKTEDFLIRVRRGFGSLPEVGMGYPCAGQSKAKPDALRLVIITPRTSEDNMGALKPIGFKKSGSKLFRKSIRVLGASRMDMKTICRNCKRIGVHFYE